MPRVIITEGAAQGLERCRHFLVGKSPEAAKWAAQTIAQYLLLLETTPTIGRPFVDVPEWRELIIDFATRAMSRFIAMIQRLKRCMYLLSGTKRKRDIRVPSPVGWGEASPNPNMGPLRRTLGFAFRSPQPTPHRAVIPEKAGIHF